MNIGSVQLNNNTIMAPLAGITNLPFRLMVKKAGCGMVCSEMISSNGLVYRSAKTEKMLESIAKEKPLSVQLFGSDPSIMADAAVIVESGGADILDINFGCSVRKILKTGSGSALMKEPQKAEALLKAVKKSISIPLTIKIRSGWENSGKQALEISRIAQDCGVHAITIHPRTAGQGFRGKADWSVIAKVKRAVSIPIIGNGDITKPEHAIQMINETGCDGIMIGRGAIGNPWIFTHVINLFQRKSIHPVDLSLRFDTMIHFLNAYIEYFGEKTACYMLRSRLGWFVKGLRFSSKFRESIKTITSRNEAEVLIRSYQERLTGS